MTGLIEKRAAERASFPCIKDGFPECGSRNCRLYGCRLLKEAHALKMPEVQTMIDECSDGSWDATLYIGSNFICRYHAATFRDAADFLDSRIANERAEWGHS